MSSPEIPLVDGQLAADVHDALDALSTALLHVDVAGLTDPSLAGGAAGLGLAHAYLDAFFPDRLHTELAQDALGRAAASMVERRVTPWLVQGAAGIGWTLAHLAGEDAEDSCAALDHALTAHLAERARPFEYMHGVAGLAVYGIARKARASGVTLLERIAESLASRAEATPLGARWLSPPGEPSDEPHENYGFAHGVPGAIAGAASLVSHGVGGASLRVLVADACRVLLARRLPRREGAWFPPTSAGRRAPSRTAFCYGDPGVAWSLLLAGRALGDDTLVEEALEIAVHATARPFASTGVRDAGFCHGAAGLAHVFGRMYRLSGRDELRVAAASWIARALSMRTPDAPLGGFRAWNARPDARRWEDDASLLTGAAGIALVLASALEPEALAWDAPLMFA